MFVLKLSGIQKLLKVFKYLDIKLLYLVDSSDFQNFMIKLIKFESSVPLFILPIICIHIGEGQILKGYVLILIPYPETSTYTF